MLFAKHSLLVILLLVTGIDQRQVSCQPTERSSRDFIFDVQPRVIAPGELAVLRWSIKEATKVVIEAVPESKRDLRHLGTFAGSGSLEVSPKEGTTYVVTCEGSTTYSCASVSIRVRVKRH